VQGRGSAANSAVCYSLGITAVDPIKMDLLFERFLSEERGEWPDIDLDLPSGDRREQVIQHVYEKYGRLGAAMTANVITYRSRSAAREVGKALSLKGGRDRPARQGDEQLRVHRSQRDARPQSRSRRLVVRHAADAHVRRVVDAHSGSAAAPRTALRRDGDLSGRAGCGGAARTGEHARARRHSVDKDDCADMGIVKVDLLGLGMMAVLQDAIELVNSTDRGDATPARLRPSTGAQDAPSTVEGRGSSPVFELAHIPPDDPLVYDLLQKADTVGVFQVESRAQMATLPRLKPTCFYDLVVEVAIIRPGPIVGDMVHPYLNRRAGKEPIVPLHPSLEPVLARTLGVPLFQEQLLRMAMVAAGFTGGQAEELRRAMGFKRSEKRMGQIEVQLRQGMAKNGITGETAERIINSITSFALYGFPESHAASFALLAYASAYLKVHYPAVFYTALLNNQPMGFYHPASLVKDAQRRGVRFHPIDVQQSDWLCRVEGDGAIRIGFMYVTGLRKDVGQTMAAFDRTKTLAPPVLCAKCGSDDDSMLEVVRDTLVNRNASTAFLRADRTYFCNICSHEWTVQLRPVGRFRSIEDVVQRTGLRRDELTTLADIGALNEFTNERRSALWQVERAVRPAGDLFVGDDEPRSREDAENDYSELRAPASPRPVTSSPLRTMNDDERLQADYAGMGLTIGPHPMALRRGEMSLRGGAARRRLAECQERAARARGRHGDYPTAAGNGQGFVFLTLEDETGISNVIVRPDLFDQQRMTVVRQPFLIVDGVLQHQGGVISVRAERVEGMSGGASVDAHDFY
jgi:error-prone DNA polymerase